MRPFLNIDDRDRLQRLLSKLSADTQPLWGKMSSRQMVEHLVDVVEYTNGKKIAVCDREPEKTRPEIERMVFSDYRIPRNVILETMPVNFRFVSLGAAILQLMKELDDFDMYFIQAGKTSIHFSFGAMNRQEWGLWHGKHFTHHLEQFGLLPAN